MQETKNLIIRRASFADCDSFADWESKDDVVKNFCIDGKRNLDTVIADFHRVTKDPSRLWLTIVLKETMEPIGRIGLTSIDPINDSVDITIIYIGDKNLRGRGLGQEALLGLLDYAFREMNMNRVTIDHFFDDEVSMHLYEKVGFRKEGTAVLAGKRGSEFADLCLRAILKAEWEERYEMLEWEKEGKEV